jgi:GNAT superfamily N-acetyltransferase
MWSRAGDVDVLDGGATNSAGELGKDTHAFEWIVRSGRGPGPRIGRARKRARMTDVDLVVRDAVAQDVPRLQDIERAAAQIFRGLGLIDLDDMVVVSEEQHRAAIAADLSVVVEAGGEVVGYAMGEAHLPACYLHEVDVAPSHGRRGAGTLLVDAFCRKAASHGATRVILSTFTEPPWNAPFYRRMGFVDLARTDFLPWMEAIEAEQAAFLDLSTRTFMTRQL